jgi:dTDP-4-dehydrorhamnose 3,5-epimerase
MQVVPTAIPDVLVLEPRVFGDDRGLFFESFNQKAFNDVVGRDVAFVQDNHSRSMKGVLRGLHYQVAPHEQGKLVRVSAGSVFDVAVDIRPESTTFGRCVTQVLSADRHNQLWIPPGFAHGFLVLSDWADFLYKTTAYYRPDAERTIRWDDTMLGIPWPAMDLPFNLSGKDRAGASFENLFSP